MKGYLKESTSRLLLEASHWSLDLYLASSWSGRCQGDPRSSLLVQLILMMSCVKPLSYYLKNQWNSRQKLNLKKLCSISRRRNVSHFVITSLAPRIVSCVIIRNQTKSSANFSILSSEVRKYILHMSRWAIFPGTGKLQSR